MIDIRQMRYFIALAETLHFGRAAQRLNIRQPPLSRQIAELERQLGVSLLDRHARRPTLTRAGERFLSDSRLAVARFDDACRNVLLVERGEIGELSLGFMMHTALTVLPGLVKQFLARFPGVELRLGEVAHFELAEQVLAGKVDVAILLSINRVEGLEMRTIESEKLCLTVYAGHPLAEASSISARDLSGEPLIAVPTIAAFSLREATDAYFRSAGVAMNVRLETNAQQTIVNLVAEGIGIALVPDSVRRSGTAGVIYRDIEAAPTIDYVVAWRAENQNPALASFIDILGPIPAALSRKAPRGL